MALTYVNEKHGNEDKKKYHKNYYIIKVRHGTHVKMAV